MNSLKILDVTLRDGGCVNDFNFGQAYMEKILAAEEDSGADIIELGYIDEKRGSESGRTQYINECVIPQCILKSKRSGITYVAMIDYGKFDVNKLEPRSENGIDGIRLAFHKKNRNDIASVGKKIMEKGYKLYVQPMITFRYTDAELLEMIELVNEELTNASAFYIVDSFGEMRVNDMNRVLNLVDHNLIPDMTLGFHSHNNLQLSYSNAIAMLQFPTNRDLIIDSSIMGMGKGAGNLNTELLMEHLNLFYGKKYNIPPLLKVIDEVVNQLHAEFYWGYSIEHYLSSVNHCSPSYASYFYNKHMLPIDRVGELLAMISEDKKISFDAEYAENLYRRYNERIIVDDGEAVKELKAVFGGKRVLLVAVGKSIIDKFDLIRQFNEEEDVVSIGLNLEPDLGLDYILCTRHEVYKAVAEEDRSIITTSSVSKEERANVKILNYGKWIKTGEQTQDSSLVIALNLLQVCDVREVMLIGFDGFSANINENYYDSNMRRPVDAVQAEKKNQLNKTFIESKREAGMNIRFLTPSAYALP